MSDSSTTQNSAAAAGSLSGSIASATSSTFPASVGSSQLSTPTLSTPALPLAEITLTLSGAQPGIDRGTPTQVANTIFTATPYTNAAAQAPIAVAVTIFEYPLAHTTSIKPATNSSASTHCPRPSSTGISTGTIAGASVGCLLGGLLIGAIVALAILRRKHQKDGKNIKKENFVLTTESKIYGEPSSGQSSKDVDLSQFLLDATPDKEIGDEFRSLSELVRSHIESHYHLQPLHSSASLVPSIRDLELPQTPGSTPESVAAICANPVSRQVGLQHVVSTAILNSIDFPSGGRFSVLPEPVTNFLRSVPRDTQYDNSSAKMLALSQWRKLSAFLLHPSRNQRTPLSMPDSAAAQHAADLTAALQVFLRPFVPADQTRLEEQTEHLQAVILECAKFGWLVMSQPSDWHFKYGQGGRNSGVRMLVVFPGLDKLSGKDGKLYRSPHQVVAPVVTQV
ncbi:hypothetical protein CSPX01_04924 [Colletotrichum filicis]|nr:hypothetical protein CSPX01_04924 [Colletotrichum filicis]